MKVFIFTIRVAVGDQELQHFIHGTHEEDQPQLGHCHGDKTPQQDGRADRVTERHRAWRESEREGGCVNMELTETLFQAGPW